VPKSTNESGCITAPEPVRNNDKLKQRYKDLATAVMLLLLLQMQINSMMQQLASRHNFATLLSITVSVAISQSD